MKNMRKAGQWVLIGVLTLSFQLCHDKSSVVGESATPFVSINGQQFIDPEGRSMVLHGINVVNKDPGTNYLGHISEKEFVLFKTWGFNVVRLGIIWDGLEPEPGKYNEDYLLGIDEMIQWAANHGIYVFLDMHQDLYSVEFSDGAPSWATITDGQPHETGAIWSDSYLISPAVQTAFDNFWNNTLAQDSMGIQDHYINLWKHIAERYKDNPTVIGFDIMNEPFMGSGANHIMPLLLQSYAKIMVEKSGQAPPSEEELMYMWSAERLKVLETLSEKEVYKNMIDAIYELNADFEQHTLTPFFQKARDAIREVDKNHIIFTEHSYFTNMGVTGALGEIVDEQGNKDPLVAYAAHGYDLVVDTDGLAKGSNERVELIFERIAETGQRLDVPVLIGEWGALHGPSPELIPVADQLMDEFNKHGFSDTYWAYGSFLHEAAFLEVLQKPYPVAVSGALLEYGFDSKTGQFSCKWMEKSEMTAPTKVFVRDMDHVKIENILVSPETENISLKKIDDSDAGYLIIPPTGTNSERSLSVTFELVD